MTTHPISCSFSLECSKYALFSCKGQWGLLLDKIPLTGSSRKLVIKVFEKRKISWCFVNTFNPTGPGIYQAVAVWTISNMGKRENKWEANKAYWLEEGA